MIIRNDDIQELILETPEGHQHLRATMILQDGTELVFQEATVANLVRAYIILKTHPTTAKTRLRGRRLAEAKEGYAEWQLVEEEDQGAEANGS
jgi:hypothetical protein